MASQGRPQSAVNKPMSVYAPYQLRSTGSGTAGASQTQATGLSTQNTGATRKGKGKEKEAPKDSDDEDDGEKSSEEDGEQGQGDEDEEELGVDGLLKRFGKKYDFNHCEDRGGDKSHGARGNWLVQRVSGGKRWTDE